MLTSVLEVVSLSYYPWLPHQARLSSLVHEAGRFTRSSGAPWSAQSSL